MGKDKKDKKCKDCGHRKCKCVYKKCKDCGYRKCKCIHKKCIDCSYRKCKCIHKKCKECGHSTCKCKAEVKVKVNVPAGPEPIGPVVCNSTCGNLLLSDQVPNLKIWKERMLMKTTVTISVFNSAMSATSIKILVISNVGCPVEFTVPPGNTLSATVYDAESIIAFRINKGIAEGKFNLEVCFPVFYDKKHK
ncbi:hypothetical protein QUF81_19660 [Peribacillus simplex]|uniref:Endospore appendages core domain-containing protein n=1 Tax=Peribacillus simplex TaxID=1478 RepID=A0AAW7ISE5_9BACI|nr:S-Ena type endospore appendage [Peribacillus simplex]MDM5295331.1 hypothetical protein [Peribacillus simplex]MDM5454296.1 hypothetical protein [Peribacillus simplex]